MRTGMSTTTRSWIDGRTAQPDKTTRQQLRTRGPGYDWYRKNGGVLGLEPYPDWFIAHLVEIFTRLKPALKLDGNLWVNLGYTNFARWSSVRGDGRQGLGENPRTGRVTPAGDYLQDKQLLMVPARFAIAMQDAGWILRNDVIWSKADVPPRPSNDDRLKLLHEHFFHFAEGLAPTAARSTTTTWRLPKMARRTSCRFRGRKAAMGTRPHFQLR